MRALLLVCTLASCARPECEPPGRAALAAGAFLPLSTDGARILDAEGRQVILRGVQVHPLQDVDYPGREAGAADYARIAGWGLNAVRFAVSWSRIEPSPGAYDDAYLDEVRAHLDLVASAGLAAIVEMHQDLWGRCAMEEDSRIANGAPDWTCDAGERGAARAMRQFDRLYADEDGLRTRFFAVWTHALARLADHPAVLGWDLLNEPGGTGGTPALERDRVLPFYRALIPVVRAAGARGLLLLDAPGARNNLNRAYTEAVDAPGIVYAPHLYHGWLQVFLAETNVVEEEVQREDIERAVAEARAMGAPLFDGEWGVNTRRPGAVEALALHQRLEEERLIGSSYWGYEREHDALETGSQAPLHADGREKEEVVRQLARLYPAETPGELVSFSYDPATESLEVRARVPEGATAPLVVRVPRRLSARGLCLSGDLHGAASRFDEAGEAAGRLLVRLGPGERVLRVRPGQKP